MKNKKQIMAIALAMSISTLAPITSEAASEENPEVNETATMEEAVEEKELTDEKPVDENADSEVSQESATEASVESTEGTEDKTGDSADGTNEEIQYPSEEAKLTEETEEAKPTEETKDSEEIIDELEESKEDIEEVLEKASEETDKENPADLFDEEKIKEEGLDLTDVELDERVEGDSDDYEDNISNYTDDTKEVIKRHTEERKEETEKNSNVSKVKEEAGQEFAFTMISDTHILPQDMIEDNEAFHIAMNSDRKAFMESEGLLDAALAEITANGSKYIMITGDLTKDGEIFGHELLAKKLLAWKNEAPGRQVFVVPGNHDINNPIYSEDYAAENPQDSPKAQPVTHREMMDIYGDLVWNNQEVILARYDQSKVYEEEVKRVNEEYEREHDGQKRDPKFADLVHGYATYSARIKNEKGEDKNGLTIIGMDATINTADVLKDKQTGKGIDGLQATDGRITYTQMSFIVDEIIKANNRNDVVTLASHHASLPHFKDQDKLLSPYIIREWETPYQAVEGQNVDSRIEGKSPQQIFDEYGVNLHFTGHLHVQDIAENKKGENANTSDNYYDIATGSIITYPAPVRKVTIRNNIDSEDPIITLDIDSKSIGEFTYTEKRELDEDGNPVVKNPDSARAHLDEDSLTSELIQNYIKNYVIGKGKSVDDLNLKETLSKVDFSSLLKSKDEEVETDVAEEDVTPREPLNINFNSDAYIQDLFNKIRTSDKLKQPIEIGSLGTATINIDTLGNVNIDANIGPINGKIATNATKVQNFVNRIVGEVDSKLVTDEFVNSVIKSLADSVMSTPLIEDKNGEIKSVFHAANDAYKMFLQGDENNADGSLRRPEYITSIIEKFSQADADVLDLILESNRTTIDNMIYDGLAKVNIKNNGVSLYDQLFVGANTGWTGSIKNGTIRIAANGMLPGYGLDGTLKDAYNGSIVQKQLKKLIKDENRQANVSPTDLAKYYINRDESTESIAKMVNSAVGIVTQDKDGNYLTATKIIIDLLNNMTNENIEDYHYRYFEDNDTRLILNRTGKIENPAVSYDELENIINFVNNLSEEYKIEGVKLALQRLNPETGEYEDVTVSKELEQDLSNIDDVLAELAKDHQYRDKVVLKTNLSNKIGNQFERASEALISATNIKKELENSEDNKEAIKNIKDLRELKEAGLIDEDAAIEYEEADPSLTEDSELEKDKEIIDKYEYTFRVRENGAKVTIEATPVGRIGTKEEKEEEPVTPDPITPEDDDTDEPEVPVNPSNPEDEDTDKPELPVDPSNPEDEDTDKPVVPTKPSKPVVDDNKDNKDFEKIDYRKAILNYLIDKSNIAKLNKDSLKNLTNKAKTNQEFYEIYEELIYLQGLSVDKVKVPVTPNIPTVEVEKELTNKVVVPASPATEKEEVEVIKDMGSDMVYVPKGYKVAKEGFYKKSVLVNNHDKLLKAVEDNKRQVQAAEYLLEKTPKTVAKVKDQLVAIIEKSKRLQAKANELLLELDSILGFKDIHKHN